MVNRVFFSDEAKQDIELIKCFFDQSGQGNEFLEDLFTQTDFLKLFPDGFQIRYNGIRIINFEVFKYSIHYEFMNKEIRIYRILHQNQSY